MGQNRQGNILIAKSSPLTSDFDFLPDEIVYNIFTFLDQPSLINFRNSRNKRLADIATRVWFKKYPSLKLASYSIFHKPIFTTEDYFFNMIDGQICNPAISIQERFLLLILKLKRKKIGVTFKLEEAALHELIRNFNVYTISAFLPIMQQSDIKFILKKLINSRLTNYQKITNALAMIINCLPGEIMAEVLEVGLTNKTYFIRDNTIEVLKKIAPVLSTEQINEILRKLQRLLTHHNYLFRSMAMDALIILSPYCRGEQMTPCVNEIKARLMHPARFDILALESLGKLAPYQHTENTNFILSILETKLTDADYNTYRAAVPTLKNIASYLDKDQVNEIFPAFNRVLNNAKSCLSISEVKRRDKFVNYNVFLSDVMDTLVILAPNLNTDQIMVALFFLKKRAIQFFL